MRLLKKLKKSYYSKDKLLLKLISLIENYIDHINKTKEDQIPERLDYVEKREIDRSILYSFDGPFRLIHADVANLEFLGKSATAPNYALLIVDLYSSKVYVYLMHSRKQIIKRLEKFYKEVQNKRKNRNMQLQVDNEFQQVKSKDLNDKYNVTMFMTSIRGGKAFATEKKIRELKSRTAKLSAISDKNKAKIPPTTIIRQSAENINNVKSKKYGISPNDVEKKSLSSERFKTLSNFKRIQRSKKISDRLDRYDQKKYAAKKRKLCQNLNIGEKVLALAERINKKLAPGKFYEQTVQNISYFNKKNCIYNNK